MNILENDTYNNDLKYISSLDVLWENLKNKTIFISGATGLIGSCFVDAIMYCNEIYNLNCKIYALGRSETKVKERFNKWLKTGLLKFIKYDINEGIVNTECDKVDFVLHLASNTHPVAYSTDPIGTITTNIIGTRNMLEFAKEHYCERFIFTSSCEIYGENRGDVEKIEEDYCGYINCNTLRAGYTESKRCGEALCQAYIKQKEMDIVIARLTRTFGPTMLMTDTKALSQFIKNGINNENIILKSKGEQFFSYTYVIDAVAGIIILMLCGENGEAYNISGEGIKLKELAKIIADISKTKVVFELPNETEKEGYSKVTNSILSSEKIEKLGWKANYKIEIGIKNTIKILKSK